MAKRQLNVSMPEEMYVKLSAQAQLEGQSMSGYVCNALVKVLPRGQVYAPPTLAQKVRSDTEQALYTKALDFLAGQLKAVPWPVVQEHLEVSDYKFGAIKARIWKTHGVNIVNNMPIYRRPPAPKTPQEATVLKARVAEAAARVVPPETGRPAPLSDEEAVELQRTDPEEYWRRVDALVDYENS